MKAALIRKSFGGLVFATGLGVVTAVGVAAADANVALGSATLAGPTAHPSALATDYNSPPSGAMTLGGHPFTMGNRIVLQAEFGTSDSASFKVSYPNASAVYLLLNTSNTGAQTNATLVGNVLLTFSDGTTQTVPLTVGTNIREWHTGVPGVVATVSDPSNTQVWAGTAAGASDAAIIDVLTVKVTGTGKTLTGVSLTNTQMFSPLWIDLAGLTVTTADPAPVPTPTPSGGHKHHKHHHTDKDHDKGDHDTDKDKGHDSDNDHHRKLDRE